GAGARTGPSGAASAVPSETPPLGRGRGGRVVGKAVCRDNSVRRRRAAGTELRRPARRPSAARRPPRGLRARPPGGALRYEAFEPGAGRQVMRGPRALPGRRTVFVRQVAEGPGRGGEGTRLPRAAVYTGGRPPCPDQSRGFLRPPPAARGSGPSRACRPPQG